jgi:hypothetical protein
LARFEADEIDTLIMSSCIEPRRMVYKKWLISEGAALPGRNPKNQKTQY